MPTCYRVRKPMKIGTEIREPGDLVPEFVTWKGHVQARIVHTQFCESTPVLEGELEAALSYCDAEVVEAWGAEVLEPVAPVVEVIDIIDTPAAPEVQAQFEDDEDLIVDDGPALISGGEATPAKAPRAELEALSWPELRGRGLAAGLDRSATKADILAALSEG